MVSSVGSLLWFLVCALCWFSALVLVFASLSGEAVVCFGFLFGSLLWFLFVFYVGSLLWFLVFAPLSGGAFDCYGFPCWFSVLFLFELEIQLFGSTLFGKKFSVWLFNKTSLHIIV